MQDSLAGVKLVTADVRLVSAGVRQYPQEWRWCRIVRNPNKHRACRVNDMGVMVGDIVATRRNERRLRTSRFSRCRWWSPDDAATGAVPV